MDRAALVLERLKGPVVPINVCFNKDGTVHNIKLDHHPPSIPNIPLFHHSIIPSFHHAIRSLR